MAVIASGVCGASAPLMLAIVPQNRAEPAMFERVARVFDLRRQRRDGGRLSGAETGGGSPIRGPLGAIIGYGGWLACAR